MARAKARGSTHLMEEESYRLLQAALPREWVARVYHPDYGIDIAVEVFETTPEHPTLATVLGAWLFIQLKSIATPQPIQIQVFSRQNVERFSDVRGGERSTSIEVIPFCIETMELATIHAMGAAIPVLLIIADLASSHLYLVCLNGQTVVHRA